MNFNFRIFLDFKDTFLLFWRLADFSISELSDFSIWKSFEFWKSLSFRNFWNFRTFEPSDFGIRTLANFELLEFPRSNIRICKTPISSPFSDFSLSSSSFQLVQFREFRVVRVRFELSNFQTFPFSSPRGPDSSQILKIERLEFTQIARDFEFLVNERNLERESEKRRSTWKVVTRGETELKGNLRILTNLMLRINGNILKGRPYGYRGG